MVTPNGGNTQKPWSAPTAPLYKSGNTVFQTLSKALVLYLVSSNIFKDSNIGSFSCSSQKDSQDMEPFAKKFTISNITDSVNSTLSSPLFNQQELYVSLPSDSCKDADQVAPSNILRMTACALTSAVFNRNAIGGLPLFISMTSCMAMSAQALISPTRKPTPGATTSGPTRVPTLKSPTSTPSAFPSNFPTSQPSTSPTSTPSAFPSNLPTSQPSEGPTDQPSALPSSEPSISPTLTPSAVPSSFPTSQPSRGPTDQPVGDPTGWPTQSPFETNAPSYSQFPTSGYSSYWSTQLDQKSYITGIANINQTTVACGGESPAFCVAFDNFKGKLSAAYNMPYDVNNDFVAFGNDVVLSGFLNSNQTHTIARFDVAHNRMVWAYSLVQSAKINCMNFIVGTRQILMAGQDALGNAVAAGFDPDKGSLQWSKVLKISGAKVDIRAISSFAQIGWGCMAGSIVSDNSDVKIVVSTVASNGYLQWAKTFAVQGAKIKNTENLVNCMAMNYAYDSFIAGGISFSDNTVGNAYITRLKGLEFGSVLWSVKILGGEGQIKALISHGDVLYALGDSTGFSNSRVNQTDTVLLKINAATGDILNSVRISGSKDTLSSSMTLVGNAIRIACNANNSIGTLFSVDQDSFSSGDLPPGYFLHNDVQNVLKSYPLELSVAYLPRAKVADWPMIQQNLTDSSTSFLPFGQTYPERMPSYKPVNAPTRKPTHTPSRKPTRAPSSGPTSTPSGAPSSFPTNSPVSSEPTNTPSTFVPMISPRPSRNPTSMPTPIPTLMPTPTKAPSKGPTREPTSSVPSYEPTTLVPSQIPTQIPSLGPSPGPTHAPSRAGKSRPTLGPAGVPTSKPSFRSTEAPVKASTKNVIFGISVAAAGAVVLGVIYHLAKMLKSFYDNKDNLLPVSEGDLKKNPTAVTIKSLVPLRDEDLPSPDVSDSDEDLPSPDVSDNDEDLPSPDVSDSDYGSSISPVQSSLRKEIEEESLRRKRVNYSSRAPESKSENESI